MRNPKLLYGEGGVLSAPRFAADSAGPISSRLTGSPSEPVALREPTAPRDSALFRDPSVPHRVEHAVQRALLGHPHLHFASLVVRRINNGVCLQGVLEADENAPDVSSIAQRVDGVQQVLNRLVVTPRRS